MPTLVLFWVWCCAYLNCAGWTLSALHQLNARGYAVVLALGFGAWLFWWRKNSVQMLPQVHWRKYRRRFGRLFPLAFLILAALAFLGGAFYPPINYDGLAYRLPRILHWLAADQWHWIHGIFPRVNTRACGIEWVSAPLLALLQTDRLLFLINTVSFLLLPGLVFSVFTRLGVQRRVAWHWMWIAPTGYCFVLQAGSIGNDLFGAVFALAAVDFALRAKKSGAAGDVFAAVLAAALMTGAKLSSLPLLLPWAIAILPSLKLFFRWPVRTMAVCVLVIFSSLLPTLVLNVKFCGDWSGLAQETGGYKKNLPLQFGANLVLLPIENLAPPLFPLAGVWNSTVDRTLPPALAARLAQTIETPGCKFHLEEMQIEENAGLGLGVSFLLLASVAAAGFPRLKKITAGDLTWQTCVRWAPVISLLVFMTQSNLTTIARILTPYYLLLLPSLLVLGGHEQLIKKSWWRVVACLGFLAAAGLLVISPARPLFPAQTIFGKIHTPDAPLLARIKKVYSVYHERNDAFAPARVLLPPDLKVLGLITYDDPETSLWRPFGSRRIEYVGPGDTATDLKARGVEYILLREQAVGQWFNCPLDTWLKRMNAQIVAKIPLELRAAAGPLDWYLIRLN